MRQEKVGIQEMNLQYMGFPIEILRRPYQKSIHVRLKREGYIRISCGRKVPQSELMRSLESLTEWLEKVWQEYQVEEEQNPPKSFVTGEKFLFLGDLKTFTWISEERRRPSFEIVENQLFCYSQQNDPQLLLKFYCYKLYY